MKPVSCTAPGKIILFGEHAVVYGRPAIAVPVFLVRAEATVESRDDGRVVIDAADIARQYDLRDARADDPIATIIRLTCARLGVEPKNFTVRIHSTIPIGGGLGSGAAVSVAIARALARFFATEDTGKEKTELYSVSSVAVLSNDEISTLAYEVEKLHHGTPSGIDNTVIGFEQPIYFVKGKPIESFRVAHPFTIAIADTGIAAPTKIAVGDVRRAWQADHARYESLFDQIGTIAQKARAAIEKGDVSRLGSLMHANQTLLREIGVSSPDIERLVLAAITAGARGAKLSGAGRGGNVIALVDEATQDVDRNVRRISQVRRTLEVTQDNVARALMRAGAKRVIVTRVE